MIRICHEAADAGGGSAASSAPAASAPAAPAPGAALLAGLGDPPAAIPAATEPGGGDTRSAPAGQAQGDGKADGPSAAYRPEGLPDHLAGASDQETIDKLYKAVDGFRKSQADRGEVPKDAGGYEWQPDGAVKDYAETAQDKVFEGFKGIAHKHGLSTKQYNGVVNDFLNTLIADGVVEPPYDPAKEAAAIAGPGADPATLKASVQKVITDNIATVEAWRGKGLDPAAADWMAAQMDRAGAHKFMAFVKTLSGEPAPALGGAPGSAPTLGELQARTADPRNQWGEATYNAEYAAETRRLYAEFDQRNPKR